MKFIFSTWIMRNPSSSQIFYQLLVYMNHNVVLEIGFLDMNYEISIEDSPQAIRMPFKAPRKAFKACWRIGEGIVAGRV